MSGVATTGSQPEQNLLVSVVTRIIPRSITLKKRGITKLEVILAVHYSKVDNKSKFAEIVEENEKTAVESIKRALQEIQHEMSNPFYNFKKQHTRVWNSLWESGFSISTSKAENSINGDRINATIYAVLSNVRSLEFEESVTPQRKQEIARTLGMLR